MAAGCGVRQKCAIFLATLALASLCHIAIAQLEKSLEATQVLNRFEAGVSALKRFRCSGSVRIFAADKGAEPALCETDEFSIVGDREGKRLRTNEECVYEPSLAKTRGLHDYHVERMRPALSEWLTTSSGQRHEALGQTKDLCGERPCFRDR